MTDEEYEHIKRCVTKPGWRGRICASDLERFEAVGDYHKSVATLRRLEADGVLVSCGLLEWRLSETEE